MSVTPKPAAAPRAVSTRGRTADGHPNPIDVHVGARLRLRRTLLGLSQEKLGEALNLTFQQVQKYERGANRIGASRLFDVARVLDVPVGFFFDDMSDDLKLASPARIAALTHIPVVDDPATSRETLELARAFRALPSPDQRRNVLSLIRSMVPATDHGAPLAAE